MLTVIKEQAVRVLQRLMFDWPEFIRYRNFTDGPVYCPRSGVDITVADILMQSICYDEDLVAEFIRTFDCS
jgi:hypothetical protein